MGYFQREIPHRPYKLSENTAFFYILLNIWWFFPNFITYILCFDSIFDPHLLCCSQAVGAQAEGRHRGIILPAPAAALQ